MLKDLLKIEDKDIKESKINKLIYTLKNEQTSSHILNLIQDIISSKKIESITNKIMDIILETTNAQRGCIIIKNNETNNLEILTSMSFDKKEIPFENFSLSIIYNVLKHGEIVITNNAIQDNKFSQYHSIIKYGIKSILCFPVIYKEEIKGVCYLDNQLSGFIFSVDNIKILNLLIVQGILSNENTLYQKNNKKIKINENYINNKCKEFLLTKREKEIVLLVIKGFTNKEISNNCYISISTLKTHLNNIYKKTNASDRDDLIKIFTNIDYD